MSWSSLHSDLYKFFYSYYVELIYVASFAAKMLCMYIWTPSDNHRHENGSGCHKHHVILYTGSEKTWQEQWCHKENSHAYLLQSYHLLQNYTKSNITCWRSLFFKIIFWSEKDVFVEVLCYYVKLKKITIIHIKVMNPLLL